MFIAIGIASSVYSNVPVDVPLDNTIRPGTADVITPDMNVQSTASISVSALHSILKSKIRMTK